MLGPCWNDQPIAALDRVMDPVNQGFAMPLFDPKELAMYRMRFRAGVLTGGRHLHQKVQVGPDAPNMPEARFPISHRFEVGQTAGQGGVPSAESQDQLLRQPGTFRSRQK